MPRFLLTILLVTISFGLAAQSVFSYRNSGAQIILAEEETKSEKETQGTKTDNAKDKISSSPFAVGLYVYGLAALPAAFDYPLTSRGFTDNPYTPPDLI